jgi:hypothetical protein
MKVSLGIKLVSRKKCHECVSINAMVMGTVTETETMRYQCHNTSNMHTHTHVGKFFLQLMSCYETLQQEWM